MADANTNCKLLIAGAGKGAFFTLPSLLRTLLKTSQTRTAKTGKPACLGHNLGTPFERWSALHNQLFASIDLNIFSYIAACDSDSLSPLKVTYSKRLTRCGRPLRCHNSLAMLAAISAA